MKELTLSTLFAVFEEIFGRGLFWTMFAVAILVFLAFVYTVVRDRGIDSRNFLRAVEEETGIAAAAILFVQWFTSSGFSDVGGPVDVIVLILIGLAGAVGLVFVAYLAMALLRPVAESRKSALPVRTAGETQG